MSWLPFDLCFSAWALSSADAGADEEDDDDADADDAEAAAAAGLDCVVASCRSAHSPVQSYKYCSK